MGGEPIVLTAREALSEIIAAWDSYPTARDHVRAWNLLRVAIDNGRIVLSSKYERGTS
jgi:hypothetical protein